MSTPDEPEEPTPPGGEMRAGEVSLALRELTESFRAHDRQLAKRMTLKPQEYHAMEHILDARGSLGPVELASRLGLAVGTTSELLDRLQQLGHVTRERDMLDGRRVRLSPTPSTTTAIIRAIAPVVGAMDRVADHYSEAETAVILRFLRDVTDTIRSHSIDDEDEDEPRADGATRRRPRSDR